MENLAILVIKRRKLLFKSTKRIVKQVFREFAVNLALFTVNFAKAVHPQIIVLSGNTPARASTQHRCRFNGSGYRFLHYSILNIQYSAFLAFFEASPSKEITRLKPLLMNDCYSTNA